MVSLFRGAGVIHTDVHSKIEDSSDAQTLLKHYHHITVPSPAQQLESQLGFVNCAAESIVLSTLCLVVLC